MLVFLNQYSRDLTVALVARPEVKKMMLANDKEPLERFSDAVAHMIADARERGKAEMHEQIEGLIAELDKERDRFTDYPELSFERGQRRGLLIAIRKLEAILDSNPPKTGSQGLESPNTGISEVNK